jgi:hypothetical protein
LGQLVTEHIARVQPGVCTCHGYRYVFRGDGSARVGTPTVRVADVATFAGVPAGTVSAVLSRPDSVPERTRAKVAAAMTELGYERSTPAFRPAAHWWRNNFAGRIFQPAVTARFVKKALGAQAVPVVSDPFPVCPYAVATRSTGQTAAGCQSRRR